jgi:hypothetical protein
MTLKVKRILKNFKGKITMLTTGPVQDFKKVRKQQIQEALKHLNAWKKSKIILKRPVFFVPGWTDEDCKCWTFGERDKIPIKQWINDIVKNYDRANYITFNEETINCKSFLDFGEVLKTKIWNAIGKETGFDIVGHSMGGLDIRAAIVCGSPLLNVNKCLTIATPHQGDQLGGLNWWLIERGIRKMSSCCAEQGKNLDPDYEPIKLINKTENRNLFLQRVNRLYQFKGTLDFCVKGSAIMRDDGIETLYRQKTEKVTVEGANHTGDIGICQDLRSVISIIKILLVIELPKPNFNYGYIFSK